MNEYCCLIIKDNCAHMWNSVCVRLSPDDGSVCITVSQNTIICYPIQWDAQDNVGIIIGYSI